MSHLPVGRFDRDRTDFKSSGIQSVLCKQQDIVALHAESDAASQKAPIRTYPATPGAQRQTLLGDFGNILSSGFPDQTC